MGLRREDRSLPRITRQPDFGKPENINTILSSLLDERDRLLHAPLQIKPDWLSLNSANSHSLRHFEGCNVKLTDEEQESQKAMV
jgi:hypothetical protein